MVNPATTQRQMAVQILRCAPEAYPTANLDYSDVLFSPMGRPYMVLPAETSIGSNPRLTDINACHRQYM
jgi:hypothetical protein